MTDRIAFEGTTEVDGRRIRGSVVIAGSRTFRHGEWLEVDPAAVVKADATNVIARLNHHPDTILGRVSNGTLSVTRTDQGISFETSDLPNTSSANDALELARGGYFGGSSFEIEGLRSSFSTDPDGTRVRRITSIKRLVDVSPVYDPAFANSTAAAFSKENPVAETEPTPPSPAPDPEPEPPKAKFAAPKDDKSEWYRTAEKFAREKPLNELEAMLDNAFTKVAAGTANPAEHDQYDAFAHVFDERKAVDAESIARAQRIQLAHEMRRGIVRRAPESGQFASDEYNEAFTQYLRSTPETFSRNTANMQQFAQTISGDGSQGGFTVPDGFVNRIVERLKAFGGIASVATEITTTTGESLRWPYIDDTANKAVIAAEDVQAASGADLVFDSIELGAYEYDATGAGGNPIEVSLPLLQDSAFDIESLLERLLGRRIGRKQADHFATGGGGTEPVGLLTKTPDTMTATVASLAAVEQIFQIDSEYRNSGNAKWIMSDTTLAKLWGAQATTNEPLFQPNRTINGKPFDTVMGYPIIIDPSAGNLVAFGDFEAGYVIRRVRGVQLLVDPYVPMVRRAVRYHAWARADGNIQDPNAYTVSTWASVTADT
jgi:HK97 family phage major capsid protein